MNPRGRSALSGNSISGTDLSQITPLRGCLDAGTIREFLAGWAEIVAVVRRVKSASPGGALIQYPKIPPSVSESLAARILARGHVFPRADWISRGGGSDIRVADGGSIVRVEVKGSGSAEFQTFGSKDYDCDLLVWLRFGDAMQIGLSGLVRATLFEHPRQNFGNLGTRVNYNAAENAYGSRGREPRRIDCALIDLVNGE